MKAVSSKQMRELDRKTITEFRVSGEELMSRAGLGVARAVASLSSSYAWEDPAILLIAGRGNNGGDAFAAARLLKKRGYNVAVWLAGSISDIRGDARTHLTKLKAAKVTLREFSTKAAWDQLTNELLQMNSGPGVTLVVDGILGTGLYGPARGPAAGAIRYINSLARHSLVLAIDAPSGLNSDTGTAEGDVVTADWTVTMGLPKLGLLQPSAVNHVGRLQVANIGIPQSLLEKIESDPELISDADVRPLIARRAADAHKGNFGHLLILGGAAGYAGAISLAGRAALRAGVGLLSMVVPRSIAAVVASTAPEAMVHGAPETELGSLAAASWDNWRAGLSSFSAILVGPGLTLHPDSQKLVERMLQDCSVPLLFDADALNVWAGRLDELKRRQAPLIITPHPAEMARLLGSSAAAVQAQRLATARQAAQRSQALVVLKGAGTLIAQADQPLQINLTGNPGMATGGSGDVLAGILGGFLAQGMKPFDAARAAVFLHGRSGDLAAAEQTQSSLVAGDLIECLPYAFRSLTPR